MARIKNFLNDPVPAWVVYLIAGLFIYAESMSDPLFLTKFFGWCFVFGWIVIVWLVVRELVNPDNK